MWLLITPFVFMFCLTCFRKSWAVIDQSKHLCCVCNSHVKQTWSNLCGTKSGTLSVWSIRSLLEGLSERRNCSHMLSSCSEGMKNCDNGSAYLQTLDTIFFLKLCSITELADEVQRLKLRNNQVTKLSARLQIDFE